MSAKVPSGPFPKRNSMSAVSVRGGGAALNIAPIAGNNVSEAICALEVLGYSQGEAAAAVGKLDPSLSVEEMIKHSLKYLSGM